MRCYECGSEMHRDVRQGYFKVEGRYLPCNMPGEYCSNPSCDGAVYNGDEMERAEEEAIENMIASNEDVYESRVWGFQSKR